MRRYSNNSPSPSPRTKTTKKYIEFTEQIKSTDSQRAAPDQLCEEQENDRQDSVTRYITRM